MQVCPPHSCTILPTPFHTWWVSEGSHWELPRPLFSISPVRVYTWSGKGSNTVGNGGPEGLSDCLTVSESKSLNPGTSLSGMLCSLKPFCTLLAARDLEWERVALVSPQHRKKFLGESVDFLIFGFFVPPACCSVRISAKESKQTKPTKPQITSQCFCF